MYRKEFLHRVADDNHIPFAYVSQITDCLQEAIMEAVAAGEKIVFPGFGTFEQRHRQARMGRNPHTGEAYPIPETYVPAFKAAQGFRDRVQE